MDIKKFFLLASIVVSFCCNIFAFNINTDGQEKIVTTKSNIKLWTKAFGKAENPSILLLMGGSSQSIMWPDSFIEDLVKHAYHVIIYDHRDTGLSSLINYKLAPYDLNDMTEDAVDIMDHYSLKQAHILGLSMGGFIAQILAIKYPDRVLSLTNMMSTTNHTPIWNAMFATDEPKVVAITDNKNQILPGPHEHFLASIRYYFKLAENPNQAAYNPQEVARDLLSRFVTEAKINSGGASKFDESYWFNKYQLALSRAQNPLSALHHAQALIRPQDRTAALQALNKPMLIIHGRKDPLIPVIHAIHANKAIKASKLFIIETMGHLFEPAFAPIIAQELITFMADPARIINNMSKAS